MHVTRKISFVYGVTALIFSCNDPGKSTGEADQAKLLKIHEDARNAHFGRNAQIMIEQFAEEMISVNHGKISKTISPEKDIERFQSYFNSVEFKKWDDVNPPEVRFSEDHTLAYMVVDKLVVLEAKDSVGKPFQETTHFAWVGIYRKQNDGDWKLECITSTNEPEVVKNVD
jgi:hypothetical protein